MTELGAERQENTSAPPRDIYPREPATLKYASASSARFIGGSMIIWIAAARTKDLSLSSVMYSAGDLPSTRARNSIGGSRAVRAATSAGRSHVTPARYASFSATKLRAYSSVHSGCHT